MEEKDFCCEQKHVHDEICEQVCVDMPDDDTLFDVAELFKIFGDSTRIRILSALTKAEISVLNMTKSAVSHQLRILRQAKLVKNRRQGKEIFYSLDDDHVLSIINLAVEHVVE